MPSSPSHDLGLAAGAVAEPPLDYADTALPEVVADAPRSEGSFARRWVVPERMDDPRLDAASHHHALRGLARLNRVSHSSANVWRPIRDLIRERGLRRLSVLDVAAGGGDIPVAIARRARRLGIETEVTGIDLSEQALGFARSRAAAAGESVRFVQADALAGDLLGKFDVVMSSLFLHHLADEDALRLLTTMKQAANRLVVVNDLVRSRLTYVQTWLASRILSRSPIVHFDGLASVRAAFTKTEALRLAERAGLVGARATGAFPCKFVLTWRPAERS